MKRSSAAVFERYGFYAAEYGYRTGRTIPQQRTKSQSDYGNMDGKKWVLSVLWKFQFGKAAE